MVTPRVTPRVIANTPAGLACALHRWRPLLVFLVVVRLVQHRLAAARSTRRRKQQKTAIGIIE